MKWRGMSFSVVLVHLISVCLSPALDTCVLLHLVTRGYSHVYHFFASFVLRTRGIWQRLLLPRLHIASFVWRTATTTPVNVDFMVWSREGSTGIRRVLSGRRVWFLAFSRWWPATLEFFFCRRCFRRAVVIRYRRKRWCTFLLFLLCGAVTSAVNTFYSVVCFVALATVAPRSYSLR